MSQFAIPWVESDTPSPDGPDFRDKLISKIAEIECRGLSRKVIRRLQRETQGMQSGDDSPLKNIWDEICVQVQGQESALWDLYVDLVRSNTSAEVERLSTPLKQSIWLQTDSGQDWAIDDRTEEMPPYFEPDITDYIVNEFVMAAAADWTNERIRSFQEDEYEFDD